MAKSPFWYLDIAPTSNPDLISYSLEISEADMIHILYFIQRQHPHYSTVNNILKSVSPTGALP